MEAPETPILDVWPLDRITEKIALAYRALMDRGVIRLRSPIRIGRKSNLAVFDYFSTMDKDRTHAALKRIAEGEKS